MAKKNFYAVKQGRVTGIFTTWDDCKAQVGGFPGAVFKGFPTEEEAKAWLSGTPLFRDDTESLQPPAPTKQKLRKKAAPSGENGPTADYIVYTDGSCLKNPAGPGGFAAVIVSTRDGEVREISGGEPSTTNNRRELRAGIEALAALPPRSVVEIYTDSQYMKNAFTKYWLRNWKRNGWITATGEPVKNQDLWRALDEAFSLHKVNFHWVKGHAGNRWNERCDTLARGEAAKFR